MHTAMKAPEAHQENIARTDPAEPDRLQYRGHPADHDCGKHGPRQKSLRPAGGPDYDRRGQYYARYAENGELQAETEGKRHRRFIVRLIADVCAPVEFLGSHTAILISPIKALA